MYKLPDAKTAAPKEQKQTVQLIFSEEPTTTIEEIAEGVVRILLGEPVKG